MGLQNRGLPRIASESTLDRLPRTDSWGGNLAVRAVGAWNLLVPDGVFVDDEDRLAFALHPVPTSADVVAILDRIVRRIARWLADEARDDSVDEGIDVLAQVQAEVAATWRSPYDGKPTVRGVERLRAWCVTSPSPSLHAGVVIADHDREALERLCRYGPARVRPRAAGVNRR